MFCEIISAGACNQPVAIARNRLLQCLSMQFLVRIVCTWDSAPLSLSELENVWNSPIYYRSPVFALSLLVVAKSCGNLQFFFLTLDASKRNIYAESTLADRNRFHSVLLSSPDPATLDWKYSFSTWQKYENSLGVVLSCAYFDFINDMSFQKLRAPSDGSWE